MKRIWFAAAALIACSGAHALTVRSAVVVPGAGFAPGVLYATIDNGAAIADTLVSIQLPAAQRVTLHGAEMAEIGNLPLPRGHITRLAPGGVHAMLEGLSPTLVVGDSVTVTFTFAHTSAMTALARVISYAQVDSVLSRAR